MNNPELSRYIVWIGLYIFLMMLSSTLEIVLISRAQVSVGLGLLCLVRPRARGGFHPAGIVIAQLGVAFRRARIGGVSARGHDALLLPEGVSRYFPL